MIRNRSIHQLIVALLLLMGPLTQFQTLYACELMVHDHEHERPSMVCCCDEQGDMGMMSCEMDGTCQDQAAMMDSGCCDLSYEASQVTQASGASAQSQQVLMLDAAQPPPLLVSFDFSEIILTNHVIYFVPDSSVSLPDKPLYLLTRRFRI
ncbi:MAG: hypothetical protein L3J89_06770 [Gammaproteobacteria bacterium]|nr:hypothetical protein [Gammaproteobacteria bacterium]